MMANKNGEGTLVVACTLLALVVIFGTPVLSQDEQVEVTTKVTTEVTTKVTTHIKCYQCNSWSDEGCANLKANGTAEHYLKECTGEYDGDKPFCRKTVQAIKGHKARVIRACGWMRHHEDCYHTDDDHHLENVCQCYTDACNEASRRRDVTFLLAAAVVACLALL